MSAGNKEEADIATVPIITIATVAEDDDPNYHYELVVLRDDQLELIRKIVREEILAALRRAPGLIHDEGYSED